MFYWRGNAMEAKSRATKRKFDDGSRHMIEIALQLWGLHLEKVLDRTELTLVFLKKFVGDRGGICTGTKSSGVGGLNVDSEGFDDTAGCKEYLENGIESLLRCAPNIAFKGFLKGLLEGTISVDKNKEEQFGPFLKHRTMAIQEAEKRATKDRKRKSGRDDEEEEYVDEEGAEEEEGDEAEKGEKAKKTKVKASGTVMRATMKEMSSNLFRLSGKYEWRDRVSAIAALVEAGAVTSVALNIPVVESMYTTVNNVTSCVFKSNMPEVCGPLDCNAGLTKVVSEAIDYIKESNDAKREARKERRKERKALCNIEERRTEEDTEHKKKSGIAGEKDKAAEEKRSNTHEILI